MTRRVVVVDLEVRITDLLTLLLQRYGFSVTVAHDGVAGLERIESDKPDLVVMDLLLPRIQGHELCWRVKHDPALSHIPVILMTALYEGQEYGAQAHGAGADALVPKPLEPRGFLEHVAKLVGPLPQPNKQGKPLHDQLWDLRERYQEEVPHKIAQIETSWLRASGPDSDRDALSRAHIATHSLAGASGTLGLSGLAARAKDFELLVAHIMAREDAPSEAEREKGAALLRRIRSELPGTVQFSEPPPPASQVSGRSVAEVVAAASPRSKRVLVVEHDPEIAQAVSRGIAPYGFAPQVFPASLGVVEQLSSFGADALVVDIGLPKRRGGGPEMVASLRSAVGYLPPVLFLSADDDFASRARAAAAGGDGFLPKPVDVDALVDWLSVVTRLHDAGPYRVLIVGDSQRACDHVMRALRAAQVIATAIFEPSELLTAVRALRPDVALVDLREAEAAGVDVVRVMRQHAAYDRIPIVLLSPGAQVLQELDAMGGGADAVLDRGVGIHGLVPVLIQRARRSRMLHGMQLRDPLTGLLGHSMIMHTLRRDMMRAAREGQELCYAIADLDGLRRINKALGPDAGDEVIRGFSELLVERLRRTDLIGRLGGDRFGLVLLNTRAWAAARVLDEIRSTFVARGQGGGLGGAAATVSIGVAEFPRCEDMPSVCQAAARALFVAKSKGGNHVEVGGR
ncbi:MAG: response regulator [Polyangiaceae bacterium]|jgi:diguanylate cyclase (GGDEF)-like protein|nr:response regulator [Polyangiaceae bacterium]